MKEGWSKVTLQEVCLPVDKVKRKNKSPDDELIYLDIGGIDNEKNRIVDYKTYTWESAPSRAQQIIDLNDVLFSTVRTYLRNIAQVQNPLFTGQIASSGFTVLRANPEALDHRFLFLYTLSEKFLSPLHKLQSGSSYPAVRDKDVLGQLILLPPVQEQRAIAAKLDGLFSELDKGVEELKSAQEKLKVYRQSVLKKAFEGELTKDWRAKQTDLPTGEELLDQIKEERARYYAEQLEEWKDAVQEWEMAGKPGKKPRLAIKDGIVREKAEELFEIPTTWAWVQLKELVSEIVVGYVGPLTKHLVESAEEGERLLSTTHISSEGFRNVDVRYVSNAFSLDNPKSRVQSGDILIARHGDSGKACLVPEDIENAQVSNAVVVRTAESLLTSEIFLSGFETLKSELQKKKVGGVQQVVNTKTMEAFPFPIMPKAEQLQIIHEIETRFSASAAMFEEIERGLSLSDSLKQSLLQKSFQGRLLSEEEIEQCKREAE